MYGRERVVRITRYDRFRARQAVSEAARALGHPRDVAERICRMIDPRPWASIDDALGRSGGGLKAAYESEEDVREIVDAARGVEGLLRGQGVHTCGVAICRDPLVERTPLRREPSLEGMVTQYDALRLEEVGVTKLDILGLRLLDILADSCRNVGLSHGESLSPYDIPYEDELAFSLLRGELDCDTSGLFLFESPVFTSFFRRVKPTRFSEIVAAFALNRPGPLEAGTTDAYINAASGKQVVDCRDKRLRPVLEETYGVLVYGEQVMRIAEEMCGFSPAEADDLRRTLRNGDDPSLQRLQERWVRGAAGNGCDADAAQEIWRDVELFGRHAFLKAHATANAVLAMRTAYMKAHYSAEYMAAVLSG